MPTKSQGAETSERPAKSTTHLIVSQRRDGGESEVPPEPVMALHIGCFPGRSGLDPAIDIDNNYVLQVPSA